MEGRIPECPKSQWSHKWFLQTVFLCSDFLRNMRFAVSHVMLRDQSQQVWYVSCFFNVFCFSAACLFSKDQEPKFNSRNEANK